MKVTKEVRKALCPICGHDLIDIRYFGGKGIITDRVSPDYKRDSFEDYEEDGQVVYVECIKPSSCSAVARNYEAMNYDDGFEDCSSKKWEHKRKFDSVKAQHFSVV